MLALRAATNNEEIVADLITTFKEIIQSHFEFTYAPLFLFCESYGGKMGAAFALAIHRAQQAGEVSLNFKCVCRGSYSISLLCHA